MFEAVDSPYLVPFKGTFKIAKADTAPPKGAPKKKELEEKLATRTTELAELQDMLYAFDQHSVLVIFQAMDAAGKDGTIRAVFSGVNPAGCQVYSFKAPSVGRARARLPVAHHPLPARARPHRHFQPQLLRRDPGGAGASRIPRRPEPAQPRLPRETLGPALRVDPRARAPPRPQRRPRSSSFSSTSRRRSSASVSSPGSRSPQELEVQLRRRQGTRPLRPIHGRLPGSPRRHLARPWAPWYCIPADDKQLPALAGRQAAGRIARRSSTCVIPR